MPEKKNTVTLRQEGNLLDLSTTMGETQSLKNTLQKMERNNGTKRAAVRWVTMTTVKGNPRWMDSDDFFHKFIC